VPVRSPLHPLNVYPLFGVAVKDTTVPELYVPPGVTVPPFVWNGFKGIGNEQAIVANCTDFPNEPDEIIRLDPFDPKIPYNWSLKSR